MPMKNADLKRSYFNPRPPRGGRLPGGKSKFYYSINFNPRPPRGGRPDYVCAFWMVFAISIHVLREEDDFVKCNSPRVAIISIHVLREEDDERLACRCSHLGISIHVLREEDDHAWHSDHDRGHKFQSTSSARRTTNDLKYVDDKIRISIHVLREEDDGRYPQIGDRSVISIHVLREEDDSTFRRMVLLREYFNPRPPRGGRPEVPAFTYTSNDFNPRPPRGGRPTGSMTTSPSSVFQSTSSARRTTHCSP